MKFTIELDGKPRIVELTRSDNGFVCSIDGTVVEADIAETGAGAYSILIGGQSFEVRVEKRPQNLLVSVSGREYSVAVGDPREWRGRRAGALQSPGSQQVVAPMPGKVIRILAKAGEKIEAGQGVVVVEAMKMQNEVRAPKSGQLERILVAEGQSVDAGEVLAIVA
jgi:biotin carboxyl carrier protein